MHKSLKNGKIIGFVGGLVIGLRSGFVFGLGFGRRLLVGFDFFLFLFVLGWFGCRVAEVVLGDIPVVGFIDGLLVVAFVLFGDYFFFAAGAFGPITHASVGDEREDAETDANPCEFLVVVAEGSDAEVDADDGENPEEPVPDVDET